MPLGPGSPFGQSSGGWAQPTPPCWGCRSRDPVPRGQGDSVSESALCANMGEQPPEPPAPSPKQQGPAPRSKGWPQGGRVSLPPALERCGHDLQEGEGSHGARPRSYRTAGGALPHRGHTRASSSRVFRAKRSVVHGVPSHTRTCHSSQPSRPSAGVHPWHPPGVEETVLPHATAPQHPPKHAQTCASRLLVMASQQQLAIFSPSRSRPTAQWPGALQGKAMAHSWPWGWTGGLVAAPPALLLAGTGGGCCPSGALVGQSRAMPESLQLIHC